MFKYELWQNSNFFEFFVVAAFVIFLTSVILLFKIHQRYKGQFFDKLYVCFKYLSKETDTEKKVKLTIRLNDHVLWVQQNKVNMNEMDCGRWNEWSGNETWAMRREMKEMKHEQSSMDWRKWDERWTMKSIM